MKSSGGRPHKFRKGDVAWFARRGYSPEGDELEYKQYAVVVGYKSGKMPTHPGSYKVVRLTSPSWQGATWGGTIWVQSNRLHKIPGLKFRRPSVVRRYHNNRKLEDRGCYCNCCVHMAIPPGMVNNDGSFKWEEENGEDDA